MNVLLIPLLMASVLQPVDIFDLEWASDPQISPNGKQVVYVRNFMDVMSDRRRSNLWILDSDGQRHRPLTSGKNNHGSPRWSPDGKRLLFVSSGHENNQSQLSVRWMDTGETARITNVTKAPSGLSWSPNGKWIAFSMHVPAKPKPFAELPAAPDGAKWAEPPKVIDKLIYRVDGQGYQSAGYAHLFVLPADGGTPRQVTSGDYHHEDAPSWTPDSRALVFSAQRRDDWEYHDDSNVYRVAIKDGTVTQLTNRYGPEEGATISPTGKHIAFSGYDDKKISYPSRNIYVTDPNGNNMRALTTSLDRNASGPVWDSKGRGVYFGYNDQGNTKVGYVDLSGRVTRDVATNGGGLALGRPYGWATFSVGKGGRIAYTLTDATHPADVAVARRGKTRRLTNLNEDLLAHRTLAPLEELWVKAPDGRKIHGWILKPADFDATKKYPMILEIHGGPHADYGPRFAAELQLYAAAGYVVLYMNPRGSSSYGQEFGNLIHHKYPGDDAKDLLAGVDEVLARGYVDADQLFVTGGSGGGVLTAWLVGTVPDRFRAAVVAKPVINWTSFVLTADYSAFFAGTWFPGPPWEHPEQYNARSPLFKVGNVKTPTMLITGEADYRTPISESEQYYQALKLQKVDTVLVRIPGASHWIAGRPSQFAAKAIYVLAWFEKYKKPAHRKEAKKTP